MFSLCISTWRIRLSSSWHSSRSSHGSSMAGTSVVNQVDGATDTRARIGDRVQTGMVVVDGITTDPMTGAGTEVKDLSLKGGFVSTGQ